MKKNILLLILLILTNISCSRIPSMKEEMVNAVDGKELDLILEDSEKKTIEVNAHFFYGNDSLYISDKKHSRIIGIDSTNKVFLEIGNLKESINNQNERFWEKELKQFVENPQEIGKKQTTVNVAKKRIRVAYDFQTIERIVTDLDGNIYVVHYKGKKDKKETDDKNKDNPQNKQPQPIAVKPDLKNPKGDEKNKDDENNRKKGMEILKFSSEGKFLYRIGEDGRDSLKNFDLNVTVIDFTISKENGIWIKYLDNGALKIYYYNSSGKPIIAFEENKIQDAMQAFLEKKENEYYRIEDIFPQVDSAKISVVINVYKKDKKSGSFEIAKKIFFRINRNYNVEDYWEFKDKNLQVFNINIDNNLLCFSYFTKERTPLLKVFTNKGKMILEKKISLQKFNYKRISISISQHGDVMGAFLKKNIIYFVLWK